MRKSLVAILLMSPWTLAAAPTSTPTVSVQQPLARNAFIATMDSEFQSMDSNHDGVISQAELEVYQRRKAQAEAMRQSAAIFAQLDQDRSGQLSLAEFSKLSSETGLKINTAPFMAQMDANRDGKVSLIEYRIATQANFDRLDTDRDGIVSVNEMRAGKIVK